MKFGSKLLILLVFHMVGCTTRKYDNIMKNREELLKKTKNTSLLITNNTVIYQVIKDNSLEEFFFQWEGNEIIFTNHLNSNEGILADFDTIAMCNKVKSQLNYLEGLDIEGYTQKFKEFGVPMKFYLDDYEQILYIPYPDSLKGAYRDYVTQGKLLTKDWYLYKD